MRAITLFASAALASTALVPLPATAQTARQPGAQAQGQQARSIPAAEFVQRAAVSNLFEIQSSRLADTKARNEQVRQFAQRMIEEHGQAGQRLRSAAQNQSIPDALDQQHTQMIQELQNASGSGFDRRYVDMQVKAHEQAVSLYESFVRGGEEGQLQQFARQTLPTLRDHLQSARQIEQGIARQQVGSAQQGQGPQGQGRQAEGQQRQARTGADQAGADQGDQADPSRIVVRQPPPRVQIDQGSPRVTVDQRQPRVTVDQRQPEIVVRQLPPTITVDQPQPEIVVRMPQPDVNVAMQPPRVEVDQPQPQVRVARPDQQQQAQVDVERGRPDVTVRRADDPNVQIANESRRPNVRFERTGEPKVVYREADGQPRVFYEEQQAGDRSGQQGRQQAGREQTQQQRQAQARQQAQQDDRQPQARQSPAGQQAQQQSAAGNRPTDEERRKARARLGGAEAETTGSAGQPTRTMMVETITDLDVYNARGERLGDIQAVVADRDNRRHVVIASGGFLGFGEDQVVFPLERFRLRGDRLTIQGVSDDDIDAMADYRNANTNYRALSANTRLEVPISQ
ncbi:DUF4142 domain-containing protein [Rhodoplanes sp. TEM]|uniref:DUF4142 domain-containing protein n=1 Tax=Rhodoplanes tepidamans TaxID=200616 RepID=A0ABT5JG69_RHOTP|nr:MULTISPECIES: DUF4142 domain-containing protein [Rhodoplanes]MDC7788709.1 DUF4142 domain-containing protein [Rhodoplanes tepidamans]MDC7982701.1 DUF4142 domain-containing protein [Rhodoplanes sp. TEM]MDQ0357651.1 putative outer membrane protein/sporulation protein YlmC with PRC-barrel domain [Rhodoplanes tepidamans]